MKTITFDETKWMLVPIEVDPDMVGAFVDASAIEGPCWAEATDGEKQEVVRMWAPCWAALLAATPAPAPAQESINDRSERQFMERMASNHEKLTEFSQTLESFTHDYQRLYSTYKSYRDIIADVIKERDSLRDQVAKPAQEQCNACLGTGRMVRDPDIGTDQECFVCDGAGYEPAQEVGLTEAERVRCLIASGCIGTVKMTYDSGPYEITRTSINASRLIDAIIAALRAKGGK